jgi:hypothetical protein
MTNRKKAMQWWNSLPDYTTRDVLHGGKHGLCTHYYQSRTWQSLTGREIEKIWNYEKRPEMSKVKEFTQQVEEMLINIYTSIGIDKPSNHEAILEFVSNDVLECADPLEWHSGDVAIAFRRWMEGKIGDADNYFQVKKVGYDKELQREEVQIHGGEHGNILLIKTDEGFVVDIYGENDLVDSMTVWEADLEAEIEE